MIYYDGLAAAADAARTWFTMNQQELPEHVREKIAPYVGTGGSPVELVVHFAEAIYANRDADGVSDAREIAAGCAVLAESYGFHGMNESSRGSALARELAGKTKASDPPEAKAEYLPPEPPAPIPAA